MKQANIETICQLIEKHGTFNGEIMGYDTYIVFKDDFADIITKEYVVLTQKEYRMLKKYNADRKRLKNKYVQVFNQLTELRDKMAKLLCEEYEKGCNKCSLGCIIDLINQKLYEVEK